MIASDSIRISIIGDIFPGELSYTKNYGIRTQFNLHAGKPWINNIIDILGKNDLVIGNLESPLVEKEDAVKEIFFGEPEFAGFLKKCGINVLNVANNHILEHGNDGFNSTLKILSQNSLDYVGNVENNHSKILYKVIKGVNIAIAGFSNVDLHKIDNAGNFAVLNEENVFYTLNLMKQQNADIKILCFHWGNEYIHIPSLEQRRMAYEYIDSGATIIAGHHPHVVQPYEQYKDGHIFYSLGNFMFDFIQSEKFSVGFCPQLIYNKGNKGISIDFNGIRLSYKNTIEKVDCHLFNKYLEKISLKYCKAKELSEIEYNKSYYTLLKKKRFIERILMKTSIIKEFYRIPLRSKLLLLKNLTDYHILNRK